MKSIVRAAAIPACVVALGAAVIIWNLQRTEVTKRKLADEAHLAQLRANQGDANAEYELGRMYFWGRGVAQDYAAADYWYQKAADHGFTKGEDGIGALYYYGHGLSQSYSQAVVWYRKAADQGDAIAQEALGTMNYYGYGVPQSYPEALGWYRKAADQNYAKADYDIGLMYWYGQGVPRDREEANRWYGKAASLGNKDAQRVLGLRLPPCSRWRKFVPVLGLVAGCMFVFDFLRQKERRRDPRLRKDAMTGLIVLLFSAMDWFQCSGYGLFPSASAATAFKFATAFLSGIVITLLTIVLWRRAGKPLLIFAGLLFVTMDLALCARARFDLRVLSAFYLRFIALDLFPLGMAVTAAVHLWRRRKDPADDASEPPTEETETPSAV